MSYNIHPIFVHFPIALLCLYSFIKIVPFEYWFPKVSWKQIQRVLLVCGVLGAFAALSTGETAEHLTRPDRNLVEMHSLFAALATTFFSILLAAEVISFLNIKIIPSWNNIKVTKVTGWLEKILTNRIVSGILAFLGLIAISITGLLGGVMVYGTTADPIAPFVLKILGL